MKSRRRIIRMALLGLAIWVGDAGRVYAQGPVSLPPSVCRSFFKKILGHTESDLALVPYVQTHLEKIYFVLGAHYETSEQLLEAIYDADIRRMAHRLRAIASSLESVDGVFDSLGVEFKILEKGVGDVQFEMEMLEFLRADPALSPLLTPGLETFFLGRISATEDRLLQHLRRYGWTGNSEAYGRILAAVERVEPVQKNRYLKRTVTKNLAKELRKIHAKVENGKLDPNEIEDGVHELRRNVREVLLTFTAFKGMYGIDASLRTPGIPERELGPLKWLVPREKKFVKNPVMLPKNGYLALVQIVEDLGVLKANDGLKEFIVEALGKMRLTSSRLGQESEALRRAVLEAPDAAESLEQTRETARIQFQTILRSQVLLKFADHLDAAVKRL